MTQQQLLLRLLDVDGQIARTQEQHQRNGLSAYEERQRKLSEELTSKTERSRFLEAALAGSELEDLEKNMARLEQSISNSSSYDTALLKNQLEPMRAQKAELEEQTLNYMMELEELAPQLPVLSADLSEVGQELEEARPEEQERLENLAFRLQAMNRERDELTAQLPAEILGAYTKTGRVDEVKQGRCRCRLEIPDHYLRQIRAGHAWVCNTCGSLIIQNLKP